MKNWSTNLTIPVAVPRLAFSNGSRSPTQDQGPTKARKLLEHFGSAQAVFHASLTELEGTGIQTVSTQSIATGKWAELAREEIARAASEGVMVLSGEDLCDPPRLKEILRSAAGALGSRQSRSADEARHCHGWHASSHAFRFGNGRATGLRFGGARTGHYQRHGRGGDTASHRGAITAKGKTILVFGTSADAIYPKENPRLSEQILALGGED